MLTYHRNTWDEFLTEEIKKTKKKWLKKDKLDLEKLKKQSKKLEEEKQKVKSDMQQLNKQKRIK